MYAKSLLKQEKQQMQIQIQKLYALKNESDTVAASLLDRLNEMIEERIVRSLILYYSLNLLV